MTFLSIRRSRRGGGERVGVYYDKDRYHFINDNDYDDTLETRSLLLFSPPYTFSATTYIITKEEVETDEEK